MHVIEHFSCHTILPIRIKDIRDQILETSDCGSIEFIPAALDPNILQGFIRVFEWISPYGQEGKSANIFYSKEQDVLHRRIVLCKEMLHIYDDIPNIAGNEENVSQLLREVSAPTIVALSQAGRSDLAGIIPALCVLLPRDSLDILRPLYRAKRLNAEAIASLARLPEHLIDFLMSDAWEKIVDNIN